MSQAPAVGPPAPEPSAWSKLDRYGVTALAWLAVAGILGLRLMVGWAYVMFLRWTGSVQRAGPLAESLRAAAGVLNVRRRVAVALSPVVRGPVLAGVFRPVILLPEPLPAELSARQIELILAHELAHIRRWDNLMLLVQRLAEMLLFFHPAVWLAGWAMRHDAEAACDDSVLDAFGGSADYADSLTRVAELRGGLAGRLLANTFAAGESNLGRRVRRVLHGRPAKTAMALSVASVAALVVIGCLGLPGAAERESTTQKDEPAMNETTHIKTPEELATAVRREDGKVWIEGVPEVKLGHLDTDWAMQLRALGVLLSHRGERADMEDLLAYSGEAFNLCHSGKWELRTYLSLPVDSLTAAAAAYGYDGRWLMGDWFHQMKQKRKAACREQTQRVLDELWREMDAGRPVLVSGIDGQCGDWFVACGYDRAAERMCYVGREGPREWSGISGLNIDTCGDPKVGKLGFWDSRVRGAIRPGFFGGWMSDVAFVLGPKARDVPARDRDVATLQLAVRLFRAGSSPYSGVTYHFGERAYEQWAKDLGELDYPADVKKPRPKVPEIYDLSVMMYQARQIVRGRSAAAGFCENAAKSLPKVKPHLDAAAKAYRQEADIAHKALGVFLDGTDEQREAWLSDEAKREAGAAAIRQMLAKERAAVAAIEKALAAEGAEVPEAPTVGATPPAAVKVEPGKEVLLKEAVKAWEDVVAKANAAQVVVGGEAKYFQSPVYLTTHVTEMRAAGWKDADYDIVAAVSGASALFGYTPTDFGPKYAHLLIGPDQRTAQATGFGYEWLSFADAEEAWRIIKPSLDAGKPVKGWHYENCMFVGYRDGAKPEDRRLYVLGDGPGKFSQWWSWTDLAEWVGLVRGWNQRSLGRHTARVAQADAKAVALRVMNDLVVWSRIPPPACRRRWPKAVWGIAGIEAYAADVADLAKKPKEHFKDTAWCACHGINGQWTARNSSGVYLEGAAKSGTFPKEVNEHLLAAAKQYRAAFTAWQTFYERLGHKAPKDAWSDKARREAGGKAARTWAECEKTAVAELAAALKALGVEVDYPPEVDEAELAASRSRFPSLADAKKLQAHDGSDKKVEWAVLEGQWSVDAGGRIVGTAANNGYVCRAAEHADDVRVTATLRAVEGDEVTVWICGSPERTEQDGYTLAVSTGGCKLQRRSNDVKRQDAPKLQPAKDVTLTFERKGATLRGFAGKATKPFIEWADPEPLRGTGHRTMGFYVWSGKIACSKIKVEDLLAVSNAEPPAEPFEPPARPKPTPRIVGGVDYATLTLDGSGHAQDSFSLAVQAAGRLLGKDGDYETIYCLSSNAFAPAIDKGENCTAWWHVQGWMADREMETVAGRLGLKAERLELPPGGLSPADSKETFERKALAARKRVAPVLRKAMEAGKVVITAGGWRVRAPDGFAPWCWWGVVTRADDDGTIAGSCLRAVPGQRRGATDRPMDYAGDCWAISVGKPTLTAHEADVTMLRQAVARIRGRDAFKADERAAYGLAAMDAWIAQMGKVPFCESCAHAGPQGMAGCAINNVETTAAGAEAAASYLRKRKGALAAPARPHIEAAAEHYDRIVELLRPVSHGFYRDILNDADKQKAHAEAVLAPVRAALAVAADELEKAMAAEGTGEGH